jgi:hypothetical protein
VDQDSSSADKLDKAPEGSDSRPMKSQIRLLQASDGLIVATIRAPLLNDIQSTGIIHDR